MEKQFGFQTSAPTSGFALVRGQAEGAIPVGSFVEKCNSEEGDANPDGIRGMVLSSIDVSELEVEGGEDVKFFYFVVFACDHPVPVGVIDRKIKQIEVVTSNDG